MEHLSRELDRISAADAATAVVFIYQPALFLRTLYTTGTCPEASWACRYCNVIPVIPEASRLPSACAECPKCTLFRPFPAPVRLSSGILSLGLSRPDTTRACEQLPAQPICGPSQSYSASAANIAARSSALIRPTLAMSASLGTPECPKRTTPIHSHFDVCPSHLGTPALHEYCNSEDPLLHSSGLPWQCMFL